MKVIIFGVARSGTTALYCLLQEMLPDHTRQNIDYVYEPFLRKKEFFNGLYHDVQDNFKYIDSISYEGILTHLHLPLFIENPVNYKETPYLNNILQPGENKEHLLVKFIRANGRFKLLKYLCPEAKFIYITRNPADVINSIFSRFSFFGGEFHQDDFPRFGREITRLYPGDSSHLSRLNNHDEINKNILFWYYMNKFVLDHMDALDENNLILCQEELAAEPTGTVKKICDFLGCRYKEKFAELVKLKVGPVTRRFVFSQKEVEIIKEYLTKYVELLESCNISIPIPVDAILAKYEITDRDIPRERQFYGLHLRTMQKAYEGLLREKNQQIRLKNEIIKEKEKTIARLTEKLKGFKDGGCDV